MRGRLLTEGFGNTRYDTTDGADKTKPKPPPESALSCCADNSTLPGPHWLHGACKAGEAPETNSDKSSCQRAREKAREGLASSKREV